jgi:cell division GTPase FtsZ
VLRLALLAGVGEELQADTALPSAREVLTLCFQLQPGHLQARFGQSLDPERRDRSRALLVRQGLGLPTQPAQPPTADSEQKESEGPEAAEEKDPT